MAGIRICGYRPLSGQIDIQGSKNAVLPMLAASILQKGTMKFFHVPLIQDVYCMIGILRSLGCTVVLREETHELTVDARTLSGWEIPKEDTKKMRSSILLMGALLGRSKQAKTWHPGGCSIGSRPIDLHLLTFEKLGAGLAFDARQEAITAKADKLTGNYIAFAFPSVGATENALLASVLAEGITILEGAAREPEITALSEMLNRMGAKIYGAGSDTIMIEGVKSLHEAEVFVPGDRIVAGTYLLAVAAAGGEARFNNVPIREMDAVIARVRELGAWLSPVIEKDEITGLDIVMKGRPKPLSLSTGPYPEFPTDLQSPLLAVLTGAKGISVLTETVFEDRFKTVSELWKMGADIEINNNKAIITGRSRLRGALVKATDLRGGAALVIAALGAEGETIISDCIHIERGYEDICRDIRALNGAIGYTQE